jgi:hypothetical protein
MPRILASALRSRTLLLSSMLFILSLLLLSHFASARNFETGIKSDSESGQNSQSGNENPPGTDKPHFLAGSYYSMKGGLSATLLLNNKGPRPLEVRPTLYSLAGERLDIAPVTIDSNSFRMIDLHEWAALGGEAFEEGSVQLFHRGRDLVLGSQIYLVDDEHSLSFDEKLSEIGVFGSNRLECLWWMPSPQSDVRLVLSNTSGEPLPVTVRVVGSRPVPGEPQIFNLSPHETRVLNVRRDFPEGEALAQSEVGAISLEHSGAKSALLTRAMVQDVHKGYSFPVQFSNPQGGKSKQYHGAGLRLGKVAGGPLKPVVVARNVGDTDTVLSGRVPYTTDDGEMGVVSLSSLSLHPGEMKLLDLQHVIKKSEGGKDIATAGLEFEYTSAPGSVQMSAQSVSENGNHVFRVPLWDPLAQRSPTGGYPWYVEGDSSTTVYIKNITDHPQQYVAHVLFTGGIYTAGVQTVEGRQTVAFNLRDLRDNQVPDEEGHTIPLDVSRGQILWSLYRTEEANDAWEDLALIGRSEQIDTAKAMSSNYACLNCCPNSFAGGYVEPSEPPDADVGSVGQFVAKDCRATCYGTEVCSKVSATWTSSDINVVTVDNTGFAIARGGGTAFITARWGTRFAYYTSCDPDPYPYPTLTSGDTTTDATATDAITIDATTTDTTTTDVATTDTDPDPDLAYGGCGCRSSNSNVSASGVWTIRPEVQKIQYQSGSSLVDITGTLYVLKGTTVTFKAIPKPSTIAWPAGRPVWGGSSGAVGSGPTKNVAFNTVSSSTSDYKTVTASSGNTVTVNVIVYDLAGVLTPTIELTGRSYVRFGIEEEVGLSFTATPNVTATQIGGLRWSIVTIGNVGKLTMLMDDGTGTYNAPDTANSVTLKLEILSGPSKGSGPTKAISIVEPSGGFVNRSPTTGLRHTQNSWSVGFLGEIFITPSDVSFYNLLFYEGAAEMHSSGWLSSFNDPHPPSARAERINSRNAVNKADEIFSGTKYGPTYGVGQWYWDIPWYVETNSGRVISLGMFRELATSDATGKATISKGGHSESRVPSNPTSEW